MIEHQISQVKAGLRVLPVHVAQLTGNSKTYTRVVTHLHRSQQHAACLHAVCFTGQACVCVCGLKRRQQAAMPFTSLWQHGASEQQSRNVWSECAQMECHRGDAGYLLVHRPWFRQAQALPFYALSYLFILFLLLCKACFGSS